MKNAILSVAALAGFAALGLIWQAQASQSAAPSLAGKYTCVPDPSTCQWSGQTFTVTQAGKELDVKNDKGTVGKIQVTSKISLSAGPPWNMLGVIMPDNKLIEWSNGTRWRKL
jgi:hypothetical protein